MNLFLILILCFSLCNGTQEITPYKYTDQEKNNRSLTYQIPQSSRFTVKRCNPNSPDIVYYFSKSSRDRFPIAILVGGSSLEDDITSIIHFHRYFLKEFLDLGVGVITIEQQGVDGDQVDTKEFMEHYTRSNRLNDHRVVIDHLKNHPPKGWNGKLIFLGCSEGGPIVTTLTSDYQDMTLATINWSGAGDFSWADELWFFISDLIHNMPWDVKLRVSLPSWTLCSLDLGFPKTRKDYHSLIDEIIRNPTVNLKFLGMTYQYHADALNVYPQIEYEKIKTPYLVVSGGKDSFITSSDAFVFKARKAASPLTYMRIPDMDHYVRKREDVVMASFDWLKNIVESH